ncbi:hypothetical protein M514_24150 [Trichuris suis]|uniref:Uncharacterized protein n=1 Tax=Trichuris suis TaxID=68888 RepID=A0A085N2L0_9BILA|nr:hypothetical protein M514_24150 [Trichuris suis]
MPGDEGISEYSSTTSTSRVYTIGAIMIPNKVSIPGNVGGRMSAVECVRCVEGEYGGGGEGDIGTYGGGEGDIGTYGGGEGDNGTYCGCFGGDGDCGIKPGCLGNSVE